MAARLSLGQLQDLLDRVVETRYDSARRAVARLRATEPGADAARLTHLLVRRAQRELAAVAAVSGGAAASPGIGTATTLATAGADAAWTLTRLAELVMAIGVAHGYEAPGVEERKAWVLATLAAANGATGGIDELSGQFGRLGGARLLSQLGPARLDAFNTAVGRRIVARLMTEETVLRLGRLVPFGLGAGIGAAGNVMVTRLVGRAAARLFAEVPPAGRRPQDADVLDVDGEEVDPPW